MASRKKTPTAPKTPKSTKTAPVEGQTKQQQLIALLRQPEGATIEHLAKTLGWQRHTVHGTLSGTLKKKLGLKITSEKLESGVGIYRIA